MKIAVAGKGGAGKTTFSGSLARLIAGMGERVFAIDADPNATLASAIGFTYEEAAGFTPLIEIKGLIEERTGAAPGSVGAHFRLNPYVEDIPEKFMKESNGVRLLVTGAIKEPSTGCYCPENSLLKNLLMHMIIGRDDTVILDMEAGFEHLTRGTAKAVDAMIIVAEPGMRSIVSAGRIHALAAKLGIPNVYLVGNKVDSKTDRQRIEAHAGGMIVLGHISRSDAVMEADRQGLAPFDADPNLVLETMQILNELRVKLNKEN